MQSNNENNHGSGGAVGVVPPAQGYAYNPLLAGQMQLYPHPGMPLKAAQGSVDDLSTAFAGLKPVYPGGNGAVISGVPGISPVAFQDGRNYYSARGPTQGGMQANPYVMPHLFPYGSVPGTPNGFAWNGSHQEGAEIPPLARRNSASSNEEVGPQTPFFGGQYPVDQFKKPAGAHGDSPQVWSTPSPYSLTYGITMPQQLWKREGEYQPADYDALCLQEPPIPRPVPAIFSSEKSRGTLDKCLKNETNTTNVYIRGLHPNTTDEMLEAYGARFGHIMSAKSMLDQTNGACKGFGFIKYHNFDDGENCIRGFFHMGYEAKWARVSHNERLKTLSDDGNTNLYISNLPMSFNEQMLMAVFAGYEVMSSKILRDDNGISRGVGFARFGTPVICREIINKYNNHQVAEGYNLSIRFADTPDQKKLKSLTAERRQFKTHEYNTAAYGPGSPYASQASPVTVHFPSPAQGRYSSPMGASQPVVYNGYNGYVPSEAYQPPSVSSAPAKSGENLVPASIPVQSTQPKMDSPSVAAHAKRASIPLTKEVSQLDMKPEPDEGKDALKNITNANCRAEKKASPAKSATNSNSPARGTSAEGGSRTTPSKTPRSKRI